MNPNVHHSLITIDKTWKQPKCSSIEEYIKVWYVVAHMHTVEYYSAIKKKARNNVIYSNMDGLRDYPK